MKIFNFKSALLLMFAAIVSFSSCDKDPEQKKEILTEDFVSYNEDYVGLNSMFVEKRADTWFVYLSAEEVASAEALIATDASGNPVHEYFEIQLNNELVNANVDVKAATAAYDFINRTQIATAIDRVSSVANEKVSAGSIKLDLTTANRAEISFSLTAIDGSVLKGESSCAYTAIPAATSNEVYANGVKKCDLEFVYFGDYFGQKMALLSPVTTFESWYEIVNNHQPYIMVTIDNELVGQNVDLTTTTSLYAFSSCVTDDDIEFNNNDASSIKFGKLKYDIDEQKNVTISGYIELPNGNVMTFAANGVFSEPNQENCIVYAGGDAEAIQAAFDNSDEDMCWLYFTPQAASSGEEVTSCKTYAMLYFENTLLGKEFDITKETTFFNILFSDEWEGASFSIQSGNLNGATGTAKIEQVEGSERTYNVNVDIVAADGKTYSVAYSGQCDIYYKEPDNAISEQGTVVATLNSAVVDTSAEPYQIWLSSETGLTTVDAIKTSAHNIGIILPSTCFDGEIWGFSREEQLSFIYKGVTYGNGNPDDSGTIYMAKLEGTDLTVSFKEWNTPFEGYYHGAATIIK